MHCLETANLVHRYANQDVVLDGIDLAVPEGSIYGFLGPNGAGKTTTLRLILGLLRKQQGRIAIFGKCLEAHRVEILAGIGSMIESPSCYGHLSATENLALLQCIHRCPQRRIGEVLALVGLSDTGNKKVSRFSLGMKQRLGIAVALLHDPRLLILDEPTNGLDANGIIEIRELLTQLNRRNGTTILLSSHLLAEIEKLVTHVGVIGDGRLKFQGTLDVLKRRQQPAPSAFVRTNDDERSLGILAEAAIPAHVVQGRILMPALPSERIATVNRRLVEAGLDVHAIGAHGDDLESIYMDLLGTSR